MNARRIALWGIGCIVASASSAAFHLSWAQTSEQAEPQATWDRVELEVRQDFRKLLDIVDELPWLREKYEAWLTQERTGDQAFARFYFETVLQPEERLQLLAAYTKMRAEGLLQIADKFTWSGGAGGVILFRPSSSQDSIQKLLLDKGYTAAFAAAREADWGLRSGQKGAQLHFKGKKDLINMHIDLNNPAINKASDLLPNLLLPNLAKHVLVDLEFREDTHDSESVSGSLETQGLKLPLLDR